MKRQTLKLNQGWRPPIGAGLLGLSLVLSATGWTPPAAAVTFKLANPNDDVVGRAFYVKAGS